MIINDSFCSNSSLSRSSFWRHISSQVSTRVKISFCRITTKRNCCCCLDFRSDWLEIGWIENGIALPMNPNPRHSTANRVHSDEQVRPAAVERDELVSINAYVCLEWKSSLRTSSFIGSRSSERKSKFGATWGLFRSFVRWRREREKRKSLLHSSLLFVSLLWILVDWWFSGERRTSQLSVDLFLSDCQTKIVL